jgi:hypothetical protein
MHMVIHPGFITRAARRRELLALIMMFLVLAAAGCGVTASAGTGGLPGAPLKCGSVSALGTSAKNVRANPTNAGTCFSQAFAKCQSASLIYTQMGVDTSVTRTFQVTSASGGCSIKDTVHYSPPVGIKMTPPADKTYTCSGLQKHSTDLVVTGCGLDHDVSIPVAA